MTGPYDPVMPDIKIYLDTVLYRAVKEHDLPVSKICQQALRRQVRIAERRNRDELPPPQAPRGGSL